MQNNTVILRLVDGLIDQEKYMLLKKLANAGGELRIFILTVSPDDEEKLSEMVTEAAMFIDKSCLEKICNEISALSIVKKLCIAVKYMISGYKTIVDYGEGRQEKDCALSIKTQSSHIHIPMNLGDKKTERYISNALSHAIKLDDAGASEMLIYYDETTDKMVAESKDDYVRRKYFDSGIAASMAESADNS